MWQGVFFGERRREAERKGEKRVERKQKKVEEKKHRKNPMLLAESLLSRPSRFRIVPLSMLQARTSRQIDIDVKKRGIETAKGPDVGET